TVQSTVRERFGDGDRLPPPIGLQRVRKRLAPARKDRLNDGGERCRIGNRRLRSVEAQANERGEALRCRANCDGRQLQEELDAGDVLKENAHDAVLLGAWL